MLNFISWLIGSKTGRITALTGLTALSAFFILRSSFQKGASSEKAKQAAQSLAALRERISIDDQITKMSLDDRRRELLKWVSDN